MKVNISQILCLKTESYISWRFLINLSSLRIFQKLNANHKTQTINYLNTLSNFIDDSHERQHKEPLLWIWYVCTQKLVLFSRQLFKYVSICIIVHKHTRFTSQLNYDLKIAPHFPTKPCNLFSRIEWTFSIWKKFNLRPAIWILANTMVLFLKFILFMYKIFFLCENFKTKFIPWKKIKI